MRIKWTTLYVDDQEQALQFYTDTLYGQSRPAAQFLVNDVQAERRRFQPKSG